jgi:LemA protein
MFIGTAIGILIVALLAYGIMIYNNLVSLKNNVSKNWSNIDVLLKQRYSELPKLIDTCQEYMQYERETLESIVQARKAALTATEGRDIVALGQAEGLLKEGLGKLFALAENYPDLKTNQSFQKLQTRISELENSIADRREFYNDSANRNNIRIQQFPDVIVASFFNFKSFDLLKFNEDEIQDVAVKSRFEKT